MSKNIVEVVMYFAHIVAILILLERVAELTGESD
jgi:hypothetical protein